MPLEKPRRSEGSVDEVKRTKTTVVGKHSIPEKLLCCLQMKCLVVDLHNCVQVTKCFYSAHSWCPVPLEMPQKWLWSCTLFQWDSILQEVFEVVKTMRFHQFSNHSQQNTS
jgi:hypothetical protein